MRGQCIVSIEPFCLWESLRFGDDTGSSKYRLLDCENSTINRRKIEFVGTINDNVFFLLKTIGLCIVTFNFYAFVVQVDFFEVLECKSSGC